jgi:hypothetical protein
VARDHQIFVRPDHPGGCFAVAFCNPRATCGICRLVDFQPEPARFLADPTANFRSVLADARGENEGIKPTQSGGQRSPARDRCGTRTGRQPRLHTPYRSPIDSKFPREDYEHLQEAVAAGDAKATAHYQRELEAKIGCRKTTTNGVASIGHKGSVLCRQLSDKEKLKT